jgi:hypothetical protein
MVRPVNLSDLLKKASPRPWLAYDLDGYFNIAQTRPGTCAQRVYECHPMAVVTPEQRYADMRLIEMSVNNFERMREALRKIADGGLAGSVILTEIAKEALKELGDL